jgi:hypothetical protein
MQCNNEYDELMHLKLDGLINTEDDRRLDEHLRSCTDCGLLWTAMKRADTILTASALQPLPVPSDFNVKVMLRIAVSAPASIPVPELDPLYQPGIGVVSGMQIVPAAPTRRLAEAPTASLAGYGEWQHRIASYVRGMAAISLSIAGTVGLLLALVLSGTIKVSGPAADAVGTIRTFFLALDTWVRSLFVNFGPGLVAVGLLLASILVMVGWQVVNGYHRATVENRGNTGLLEAAA